MFRKYFNFVPRFNYNNAATLVFIKRGTSIASFALPSALPSSIWNVPRQK